MPEFMYVSKRTINIRLYSNQSIHFYRPIFFEFFAFSAISIGVHASIIGVRAIQRKTKIDSVIFYIKFLKKFFSLYRKNFPIIIL